MLSIVCAIREILAAGVISFAMPAASRTIGDVSIVSGLFELDNTYEYLSQGYSVRARDTEEGQWGPRLGDVMASGGGSVGFACQSQQCAGRITQGGHGLWDMAAAYPLNNLG